MKSSSAKNRREIQTVLNGVFATSQLEELCGTQRKPHSLHNRVYLFVTGSLPPSPADSGVSDVDSSSSGHTSNDELRARLQPNPASSVNPTAGGTHQGQNIIFPLELIMTSTVLLYSG